MASVMVEFGPRDELIASETSVSSLNHCGLSTTPKDHPPKMQKPSLLNPRLKTLEHIVGLVLVVAAIILTAVYLNMGIRPSRSEIMVIPIAVKSIVIIGYQLLSEHMARFSRWRSFKANVILNCVEIVFWLAAIVVKFMGISRSCSGSSCAVNWIIVLVAFAIFVMSIHVAALSIVEYRLFKKHAGGYGASRI